MAPVIRIGSTSWTTHEPTALGRKSSTANYPLGCRPRVGTGHSTPCLVVPDYPTQVRSNSCHTNPGRLGHDYNTGTVGALAPARQAARAPGALSYRDRTLAASRSMPTSTARSVRCSSQSISNSAKVRVSG